MTAFSFLTAGRIRFGRGVAQELPGLVADFGREVIVVHGRDAARIHPHVVALRAAGASVSTWACGAEPTLAALQEARAAFQGNRIDCVVGIGGGSALDFAKALAALLPAPGEVLDHLEVVGRGLPLTEPPVPFIGVPTTAGTGAEVTKNAVIGVPEYSRKVSLRDDRMLARVALVDPALTDGTPVAVTLASGLDAITQVVEPYISGRANPLTDALCREAIPRGFRALFQLIEHGEHAAARDDMALVSLFGGIALANAGLGAVHGFAGVIGGMGQAAHGAICGTLLPHVLSANYAALTADPGRRARIEEVWTWMETATDLPQERFSDWTHGHGLPDLGALGVTRDAVPEIASSARQSSSMAANPVALDETVLRDVLCRAIRT